MKRLNWTTTSHLEISGTRIPLGTLDLNSSKLQTELQKERAIDRMTGLIWPLVRVRDNLFIDGFIEWIIGRWIREFSNSSGAFLEIGCGDMSLQKYLPRGAWYNAFDLSLSEFHLRRVLRNNRRLNLAIASVTDIPLDEGVATLLASTQVLEYVSKVDHALDEIYRVSANGSKLLVSVANGHCRKYQTKGPHWMHVNFWSKQEFVELMATHNFRLTRFDTRGYWIPLPVKLVSASYELPIRSRAENLNSYLFFVFEVLK